MSRSGVRVRAATPDDLEAVVGLAGSVREAIPVRPRGTGRRGQEEVRDRCARLLEDPAHRVVLAVDDGTRAVIGVAVLGADTVTGLLDPPAVYVSHLLVSPEHRKRGAGRALVAAAAGYAEELGVDSVVVGVSPAGREANRFFARLGFAPLVIRRIASVAALRRTLGMAEPGAEARAHVARRGPTLARAGLVRALPRPRARRIG
jgi:ribosomal protein S18 acetylase RimI-like enzyme